MRSARHRRGRFALRSIRGRSVLVGAVLLLVFGGLVALSIWRTSGDRAEHAALQSRSNAVAALQKARAQFYLSSTLLAAAPLFEDPLPLVDSAVEAQQKGGASLREAEAAFAAGNDLAALSAFDGVDERLNQLRQTLDPLVAIAVDSDAETVRRLANEYLPQLWPTASQILTELGQLADVQQAKLTAATAEANTQANTTLWLLSMFGVAGFLVVLAALANLVQSALRPLDSLQHSVRAVTSGDMESRAEVSGPEEIASLATDFNSMVDQLNDAAALMRHRFQVESAVARTSAMLDSTEDIDSGLNKALQILAEAVETEHSYVFMFKDDNTKMDNTHEWNAGGLRAALERFSNLDCATYPWWVAKLTRNEEVIVDDVSRLPEDAAAEASILAKMRARCALAVPFGPPGRPTGFVGFGDKRETRVWQEDDIRLLRLASESISSFLNRRNAERALRESEQRFRTLSASAPIGIFQSDVAGKVVFVNDRFVEISGVNFHDGDRHWFDAVHPEDREHVIREVIEAIKARGEFVKQFRLLTPQGETRWVAARARDMRSRHGRFIGLVGTIDDITGQREAAEALRQSEERFRSLSTSAPVGILLTDADGVITYANDYLREIAGVGKNEHLEDKRRDQLIATLVHPDDRASVAQAATEARGRDNFEFLREFRIVTRQGEVRWVRLHSIPISSESQAGHVATVGDITEHKTLDQERQSAYERTTLLLAMAAEARDPYTEHHLYRIRGYSEAIAVRMGLDSETAKRIGLASLLHDIGKTRVPDAILTKPGPLTEAEWQIMRRHPIWGEELLPDSAWFATARQITRWHHENWDGTGYPDGLSGESIPLAAAIVAVADGFDAMTSKRPYKGAWPSQRAMRELRASKGGRYSPEVVEAFERACEEGLIAQIARVRRSTLSDLMKAA